MSPFEIDGPACISFSGGRTSAFMLRCILDVGLRPDVYVLFADTGKERPETYGFVREVAKRWAVRVIWVRRGAPEGVTPFEHLITERGYVPGWRQRFCTVQLKIEPMRAWMKAAGFSEWTNVVGIRADEPRRVAKLRGKREKEWEYALPLAEAGATEGDVMAFWRDQQFDLQLRSYEGNCDLCFLKSRGKVLRIMRERPELADWWIAQEERTGTRFRLDRPTYRQLRDTDAKQALLFSDAETDGLVDCICHEGQAEVP